MEYVILDHWNQIQCLKMISTNACTDVIILKNSKHVGTTWWQSMISKLIVTSSRGLIGYTRYKTYGAMHWTKTSCLREFYLRREVNPLTMQLVSKQKKKSTSLTLFYQIFKRTIARWRKIKTDAEFYCSRAKPTSTFKLVDLYWGVHFLSTQRFWRGV